jgi:hypothetical protein
VAKNANGNTLPFERIKRTNDAGIEFWSSRDLSGVLDYGDYRNFEGGIEKAKMACCNCGHRLDDVTEMIEIGSGTRRYARKVRRGSRIPGTSTSMYRGGTAMKSRPRKLALHKETVRQLTSRDLVVFGGLTLNSHCVESCDSLVSGCTQVPACFTSRGSNCCG